MQSCQSSYFNYIHCWPLLSTLCPHWLIDLLVKHSFYTVLCSFHPTSILNVRCKQALSNIQRAVSGLGSNRQPTRLWWVWDQMTCSQPREYRSSTATTAKLVETSLNLEASTRQSWDFQSRSCKIVCNLAKSARYFNKSTIHEEKWQRSANREERE